MADGGVATRRFKSTCTSHERAVNNPYDGQYGDFRSESPRGLREQRQAEPQHAVVPIFSRTPASMTEPAVGASVCASAATCAEGKAAP